mmetsp:Transcript_52130/g.124170  ORF Transcript_52130/g.124170 Transcript_52130/m.124170 type:complete len:236 (+) Transcript_52130:600-1307(+)
MITIDMNKLLLLPIRILAFVLWPHEDQRGVQDGHQRQNLVGASVLRRQQKHPRKLWLQRELGCLGSKVSEAAIPFDHLQGVQLFKSPHESLWGRRIDEWKMNDVLHTQLQQLQHHHCKVGAQNLWKGLVCEASAEGLLCVESVALAWASSTGSAGALCGRCLGDRAHQQGLLPNARVVDLLLGEARIHDVHNAIYSNGGFSNVRRYNHLPTGRTTRTLRPRNRLEDPLLQVRGQG